ncbi:MAG: hypothetical protein ACRDE2_09860, partial [Chitinophagaceae bacterium]
LWIVAQSNHEIIYEKTGSMVISGDLNAFPDSLMHSDQTTGIFWLLANDTNNLFIFLKTNDKRTQDKILLHGITIAVNAKGKKKTSSSLTFPVIDQEALIAQMNALRNSGSTLANNEFENLQKEKISQFNEVKVAGLKKMNNGDISLPDQYGIDAKMLYDSAGNIFYEMKIPFQYVNIDASSKRDIAVNIKINSFDLKGGQSNYTKASGSGSWHGGSGMGRGGGGFHGGNRRHEMGGNYSSRAITKGPSDFWVKGPLSQ